MLRFLNKKISSRFIKNKTIYRGNIFLKFEKYPHYSSTGSDGKLNSILFNLGFTKLVSRIKPRFVRFVEKNTDNKNLLLELNDNIDCFQIDINEDNIKLIELYTGGKIGKYWVDNREPRDEFTLPTAFLTNEGECIGDEDTAWWYYKNNLVVTYIYPHGCAKKIKKQFYKNRINNDNEIEGYYGFTHRGGSLFKIGDRLFDENYEPSEKDYDPKEWKKYLKKQKKSTENSQISDFIPFNKRGNIIIKNWEQAEQAARNVSRYLS